MFFPYFSLVMETSRLITAWAQGWVPAGKAGCADLTVTEQDKMLACANIGKALEQRLNGFHRYLEGKVSRNIQDGWWGNKG